MPTFGEVIRSLESQRKPYAIATIIRVEGSSIAKPGFKLVVDRDGEVLYGTLGGVCPEGPVISVARQAIRDERPRVLTVHLVGPEESLRMMAVRPPSEDEVYVETFCGGKLEVFIEPRLPKRRLIIVAQGGRDDVEEALIQFGRVLGFETWSINPSPVLNVKPDVLITDLDFDIGSIDLGERDHVVVLTKGGRDVEVLEKLSRRKVGYVGLVASRKRVAHDIEQLRARGVPEEFIRELSAPAGIDIGAYTPEEVALSVTAEIVARIRGVRVRRKGEGEVAAMAEGSASGEARAPERVEVQLSGTDCALPERGSV